MCVLLVSDRVAPSCSRTDTHFPYCKLLRSVVAAWGISDGRGLAAALMLGATGVSMGTRFLASVEAQSSPAEAAGLVAAGAEDTRRTPVFDVVRGPAWPDGYDGRVDRKSVV